MKHKYIGWLLSRTDYSVSPKKCAHKKSNILLLSGLAGSGKTSICQKIIQKHNNVNFISLDVLKFYHSSNDFSKVILNEFLLLHPEIAPLVSIHWEKESKKNINDLKYTKYSQLFFKFICNQLKDDGVLYIIEGIQLFARIPWSWCLDFPCLILRKSVLHCFFNVFRRYLKSEQKLKTLAQLLDECRLHHLIQPRQINKFIFYLSKKRKGVNRQFTRIGSPIRKH